MIRRTQRDAQSEHWLLVSQIEHARVAGLLARHWIGLLPEVPDVRRELLAAICRHDDGWADWERAPDVDSTLGRPLDFTETPLAKSLAIWQKSIDAVAGLGPLAEYVVSGHFSAMLARSAGRRGPDKDQEQLVDGFLARNRSKQADWLAEWCNVDTGGRTPQLAQDCLGILQSFDALSLWLCCGPPGDPFPFTTGQDAARPIEFRPLTVQRIEVSPWPLTVSALELRIAASQVPGRHYPNGFAVMAASKPATIRVSLVSSNEFR